MSNWVAVVVNFLMWVSFGIVGVIRMSGHKSASTRMDTLEKDIKDHLSDENPHDSCAAHTVLLKSVADNMKRLDDSICTLDERVYKLVQNGGRKPQGENRV